MKKRILSLLLTLAMVVGLLPAAAFAEDHGAGEEASIKLMRVSDDSVAAVIYDRAEGVNASASETTCNLSYNPTSNTLSTNGILAGSDYYLSVYQMGGDFRLRVGHNAELAGIKVTGIDRDAGLKLSGSGQMTLNAGENLEVLGFGRAPIIIEATKSGEPSFDAGSLDLQIWGISSLSGAYSYAVAVNHSTISPSQDAPVKWDGDITSGELDSIILPRYVCVQHDSGDTTNVSEHQVYVNGSGKHYVWMITDPSNYDTSSHEMYEITNWDDIKDYESTFSGPYAQLADTPEASAIGGIPDGYTQVPEDYTYVIYATNDSRLVQFVPPQATDQSGFTEAHAYFDEGGGGVLAEGSVIVYATVTGNTAPTAVVNYTDSSDSAQTLELTANGSNGSYSFTGTLPAAAASVQSVVLTITPASGEPITKTIAFGKDVKSCLTVTLTGAVRSGSRLSVADNSGTCVASRAVNSSGTYDLGYLPSGSYTVKVTCPVGSRTIESGAASVTLSAAARAAVSVGCSEVTVTTAAPTVTPSDAAYNLYWYDAASGGNLIGTGLSFDLVNDETVYVCAIPTGTSTFRYGASSRVAVTSSTPAPALTLGAVEMRTVSGTVTMGGKPVDGAYLSVSVTAESGGSTSRWAITDSNGTYTVSDVPEILGAAVKLSASHPLAEDYIGTLILNSDLTEHITLTAKQGAVACNWEPIAATAVAGGEDVPVTLRSGVLCLDPDKLTANGTVRIHLESDNGYAEVDIALDGNKCGTIDDSIPWTFYSRPFFELDNPYRGSFCLLTYDSDGTLVDTDTGMSNGLDGSKTVKLFGTYRSGGTYTYLFLLREAYFSLEPAQVKTLSGLKTAVETLGGEGVLYLEKEVVLNEVQGGSSGTVSVIGALPGGTIPSLALNRASSGLTLDADEKYVSARVNIAPNDIANADRNLTVSLETNQVSGSSGPNVNIVPGSLYINGKRAEDDVVLIPGSEANQTDFDGTYRITIPDVGKYGGYPATVQWQSSRATSGTVTASALVRFGNGSRQFVGSGMVTDPMVSLYVPSSVGDGAFTVYGYAPEGTDVNIRMDDLVVASVVANTSTGFYSAEITLPDPIGYEEHSFQAQSAVTAGGISYSCESAVQKTVYSSSLPHISRIEISDYRNTGTHVLWDNGEPAMGYYWYLPQNPVTYFISFENITDGSELESVTVHLPRSDGVELLEAAYNSESGKWETEPFLCGNTPPTGAWVSYVAAAMPTTLTDADFARIAELENHINIPDSGQIAQTNSVEGITAAAVTGGVSVKVDSLGLTQEQTLGAGAADKVTEMTGVINSRPADSATAMSLDGTSQNAVYNTVAFEDGKWVYRSIEKIPDSSGANAIWQETVMTEDRYTVTVVDDKNNHVETTEYKLDSGHEIPVTVSVSAGNNAPGKALDILQSAWAEQVLSYRSGAVAAMSPSAHSFSARVRSNEPTNVWDNDSNALMLALLLNCLNENGGSPGSGKPLEAYCWPQEHLGGGLYQNLEWKLGCEKLKVLNDYISGAMEIAGTGGDYGKLAEWAQEKGQDSAWDKFTGLFGGGENKEIHDLKKRVYEAMLAAEKEGQKVDWSKFPGFDQEFPDPRVEQEEPLRGAKEKKKQRADEKGDAVPDTSKPIIDPSGFVYEGVESNRIEDVTASLYQVNESSGARSLWPAAEYDQLNPQVTDEFGQYQWMVPEGWWSVTFTKGGYTSYTTGQYDGTGAEQKSGTWAMPVAPAQLDVNINLQRLDNPAVEDVKVTAEGIYVIFSQYMNVTSLNDDSKKVFTVTVNGVTTEFAASDLEFQDEENGYARTVLLEQAITESDTVNAIEVKDTVESYTGKTMTANYLQTSNLERTEMPTAATPQADKAAGEVASNTSVTLSADDGAKIYYTTNGSTPTIAGGTLYSRPILITGNMTIKAIAVETGKETSDVLSVSYTVKVTVPTDPGNNNNNNNNNNNKNHHNYTGSSAVEPEKKPCDGGENCISHPFSDVDTKQWYHEAVDYVIENKLMTGEGGGRFNPNGNLTRAMLCQIFYSKEGCPAGPAESPFIDVPTGQWYTEAVRWAAANGIVSGYGDGRFGPDDSITREQLATILCRYAAFQGDDVRLDPDTNFLSWNDVGDISDWARDSLFWCIRNGIINGTGNGTLAPRGTATRAQVAQMLMKYLSK